MGRIPENIIERLKAEVSLQQLATAKGIELKRQGRDWVGLCPFHEEQTPSFLISCGKNLFHCMGCGAGGSVIDFVMKTEGISFRHAVERLRQDYLPFSFAADAADATPGEKTASRGEHGAIALNADCQTLLNQVIGYYHETLKQSPEALAYLEKRGLVHSKLIDRFKLGFANRTLGYRLPPKAKAEGAEARGRLMEVGILRKSGHEHFNGSLVVPVFDADGNVVEVYGRKIRRDLKKGTAKHLYLPGSHRGVWNAEALAAGEDVILCEALIDALTFWVHGFRNVTACFGANGLIDDHLTVFKGAGIKRVLIAFDRDAAGDAAAAKAAARLAGAGFACSRVQFPFGMDVNDYALKATNPTQALTHVLRKAVPVGETGSSPMKLSKVQSKKEVTAMAAATHEQTQAAKEKDMTASVVTGSEPPNPSPLAADAAGSQVTNAPVKQAPTVTSGAKVEPDNRNEAGKTRVATQVVVAPPSEAVIKPAPLPEPGSGQRPGATASGAAPAVAPPAAPVIPDAGMKVSLQGEDVFITRGLRTYRVRSIEQNLGKNVLRVNVFAYRGESFHVDVLNLYSAYHRSAFAKQTARELGVKQEVVEKDLGRVLLKLEELQDELIRAALEPPDLVETMTDEERVEALAFLKNPSLLDQILNDFMRCGMVGEQTNKLVGYLVAVSRKLRNPLGAMIQSASASGKTTTMDSILEFVPEEDLVKYSAITGQALYYMGETDLKHKIIALVEEEGAEKASYPLKLLLSEGELVIASTGKNQSTGQHATQSYKVKGPVAVFVTTTSVETDEEFQNRCLVLTVDESREQTRAIHKMQRYAFTLEGVRARRQRSRIIAMHRNAQRLLRPLVVVNPFAEELTFQDEKTRMRRDQMKYLNLIATVTFLHQYQRQTKSFQDDGEAIEYVEATIDDIAVANRLAHEVLGRTLDELPPQTRKLLLLIRELVEKRCEELCLDRSDYRFTRRDVREYTSWGNTQLKIHMHRLEDLEYVVVHRAGRGQHFQYELLYNGEGLDKQPFLMGLLDIEKLKHKYDIKWSGQGRPKVGAESSLSQAGKNPGKPMVDNGSSESDTDGIRNRELKGGDPSVVGSAVPAPRQALADTACSAV